MKRCTPPKERRREDAAIARALSILRPRAASGSRLGDSAVVAAFFALRLAGLDRECLVVAGVNSAMRLLADEIVFQGSASQIFVHSREIARFALTHNATGLFLAHNHPSGNPKPSAADVEMTQGVYRALQLIDVQLHDHIIVGGDRILSFAANALEPVMHLR